MAQQIIDREDLDYEALGVPDPENGVILEAFPGVDDNGWTKGDTWVTGAESSGAAGDWAFGPMYSGYYTKGPTAEGLYLVVEETYYVTAHTFDHGDDAGGVQTNFDVTGMYQFTTCTNPDDPGMTEVSSDYSYDDDIHATWIFEYEKARALAEDNARADQRFSLCWEG